MTPMKRQQPPVDPVEGNFEALYGAGHPQLDYSNPAGLQWDKFERLMDTKGVSAIHPSADMPFDSGDGIASDPSSSFNQDELPPSLRALLRR